MKTVYKWKQDRSAEIKASKEGHLIVVVHTSGECCPAGNFVLQEGLSSKTLAAGS